MGEPMDIEEYARRSPQYYRDTVPVLLGRYLDRSRYDCLLDCGCGDGSLLHALHVHGYLDKCRVLAVDLSPSRLGLVQAIRPGIVASVDNAEELATIPDRCVDVFLSTQVIEHVDDDRMVQTIRRVTKPNALVYLSTVFRKWYGWYFYRHNGRWVLDPTHRREYMRDEELLGKFDAASFDLVENVKRPMRFPVVDLFAQVVKVANRRALDNPCLRLLRRVAIRVPGYYHWELVFRRK